MEEMGIVRRLDALGRVVIPREFRKMNRIEVGDPLEIRALAGGDILVRKVDLSSRLKAIGEMAISSLNLSQGKTAAVCSLDSWLLFSDSKFSSFEGKEIPESVSKAVAESEKKEIVFADSAKIGEYVRVYPVAGDTGVFGALVYFADSQPTQSDNELMETLARFMGRSMQNF